MKVNYQNILDETLAGLCGTPSLLLHACCAPCSSYVLEYLSAYFNITVLFYNPNIAPDIEFTKRAEELKRFVSEMTFQNPVQVVVGNYEPERFYEAVKGLEKEPEGGARCEKCFRLRLREAAMIAKEGQFDFFTTTLTISPLKNAELLNTLGTEIGEEFGVSYLQSDFKKRDGYKRSIELSKEHGLYRQDYCGCVFSKREESLCQTN